MQTSESLGTRRAAYVLDVICNRFYFEDVQEEVLGQCAAQGISAPRTEGLSAYPWSVLEKTQAEWSRKCLCKYSTEVSSLSWKFWKT